MGPYQFRSRLAAVLGAFAPAVFAAILSPGAKAEIVLNDPEWPMFHSNALDQPRLNAVLTRGGEVIEDEIFDPWTGETVMAPAMIKAFIDTGASGFAISNLHVGENDDPSIPSFHFTGAETLGEYTNLGLGGEEVGDVVGEFGIRVRNGVVDSLGAPVENLEDFIPSGDGYRLWARRAPGVGEILEVDLGDGTTFEFISSVNIIGMPVIEQRAMVMNWLPLVGFEEDFPNARQMETLLLDGDDPAIPATNVTLDLRMESFVGEPPAGEMNPTSTRNPLVENVTIAHDPERDSVSADWLFDTGAGASFISFDWAQTVGLIPGEFEDLESYVVEHEAAGGILSQIGGIGPEMVTVPVLELNELRVPAREGFDLVWQNVRILVFEHPELAELGLEGIFGMNLIGPAITLDASVLSGVNGSDPLLLLDFFDDISPSPFDSMVFEVIDEASAELRLYSDRVVPVASFADWREEHFGEDAANEEVSGPAADPGDYGIPNLLRYAFDLDPHRPQRDRLPEVTATPDAGNGTGTEIEFRRLRNDVSVEYRVEGSTDLLTWEPVEAIWNVVEVEGGSERVSVRIEDPPGDRGGFFRVRVVKIDE